MKLVPEIKKYFDTVGVDDKKILLELREEILDCLKVLKITDDRISEKISYGMPAICVDGKACFGFAQFTNHCTFFPFSGTVLKDFEFELKRLGFTFTKSGVHFTRDKKIPKMILKKIIIQRLKVI